MSRKADTAVEKLKVYVSQTTLEEEKRRDFKRFYKDDRVRLRSKLPAIGTVIRAAVADEGGLIIEWDDRPGELHLHNPRYVATVWLDDDGEEI